MFSISTRKPKPSARESPDRSAQTKDGGRKATVWFSSNPKFLHFSIRRTFCASSISVSFTSITSLIVV